MQSCRGSLAHPRVCELPTNKTVPLPALDAFYNLSAAVIPEDRPYIWTQSVTTLDGHTSFNNGALSPGQEVALAGFSDGGDVDWRLLNASWAQADAVCTSGAILRAEPSLQYILHHDDLLAQRQATRSQDDRGSRVDAPLVVVISSSGDVDPRHPIFSGNSEAVVFTTHLGLAKFAASCNDCMGKLTSFPYASDVGSIQFGPKSWAHVVANPTYGTKDGISLTTMMNLLRKKYNVKLLQIDAGGKTIGRLIQEKLIDEIRVTLAGQLAGSENGVGMVRPRIFEGLSSFEVNTTPIIEIVGLRTFGMHHVFLRGRICYRH